MIAAAVQRFWPTIACVGLLIGGATLLWWAGFNRDPAAVPSGHASQPGMVDDPAADYLAFASRLGDDSANPDAMVEGLRKLAGAVGALEPSGQDIAVDLRVAAEHVLLNPDSPGTTEAVRASLLAAADALDRVAEPASLRPLAETIDRGAPLAQQQDELARFFARAAEVLRVSEQPAS